MERSQQVPPQQAEAQPAQETEMVDLSHLPPEEQGRPVRVYADGIFDLFHLGHARALEQAKKLFPNTHLLVGCCNDELTHKFKGKTVFTDEERYESLRHCKWVDEVVTDAPWVIDQEFLDKHRIDYVAHDDLPYADTSGQADDVYGFVKRAGRFRATQRTEGISTSDVILRILKNYNEYVLRNLKRGYTRKQLGVSLFKEQRIRARDNIKRLSQRLKEQRMRVADRVQKRTGRLLKARSKQELTLELYKNGEELAANVETAVSKVLTGAYGKGVQFAAEQVGSNMDRFVTGFIRSFEEGYSKLESTLRSTVDWVPSPGSQ